MMRFFIWSRLLFYLRELKNPWKLVLTVLLITTAWVYGYLFGSLFNKIALGTYDFIPPLRFFNSTLIALAGLTIIRMIFPGYNPLKMLFAKYYPLSTGKRYVLSLLHDFMKPYFFYTFLFILSGSYHLEMLSLQFMLKGALVLVNAHLIRRLIQYMVDFKTKRNSLWVHGIGLTGIGTFGVVLFFQVVNMIVLIISFLPIFMGIGLIQEASISGSTERVLRSRSKRLGIILKLLLNNKKARMPLLVGLIFKLLILLADFFLFKIKGEHLFEGQLVFWLLASPLLIYTYVYNNLWGFWRNIWLNLELRTGQYILLLKYGFRLMVIPLALDAIITIPILLLTWDSLQFILVFYVTNTLYLVSLAFLWSLITPKRIASAFQMRGSTSQISIIAGMAGVLLLTTLQLNSWFYLLIPLYVILGTTSLWLCHDMYKEKKYLLVRKLMKS